MLTSKGRAKVLDFGLGRMLEQEGFASSINTETTPDETGTGVVMGTAPYMSPEQARGDEVDHRTDIWSLGCVLFEMLSGQRAFPGAHYIRHHRGGSRPRGRIGRLCTRRLRCSSVSCCGGCLQKDQGKRLHDIADARIEIEEALSEARAWLIGNPAPGGSQVRGVGKEHPGRSAASSSGHCRWASPG